MRIESAEFGTFEVAEDQIIEFPAGLPGFEHCRRFALARVEGAGTTPLFMLQSADDPQAAFSVTAAENLGVHYELSLSDDEVAALALDDPADAWVAVIVRKDDDPHASPATAGLRANFMAPLVINVNRRQGLQKVIGKVSCTVTLRAAD